MPPTIYKPEPKWTGKQVISTILKNIVNKEEENAKSNLTGMNIDSTSKLPV